MVRCPRRARAERLGAAVFRTWVLPFEVLSVLLLAALVGAIVVSRPDIGARTAGEDGRVMHPVIPYVIAALLFGLGVYGVLVRRNAVLVLMAVELMLNAVNLVLVTADATVRASLPHTGQVVRAVRHRARRRRGRRGPGDRAAALPAAPVVAGRRRCR